jgi:serine phosphatase RsbU (regulator of sigma subunit)
VTAVGDAARWNQVRYCLWNRHACFFNSSAAHHLMSVLVHRLLEEYPPSIVRQERGRVETQVENKRGRRRRIREEEGQREEGARKEEDILLVSPLAVVEDIKQLIQVQTGYQSSIR